METGRCLRDARLARLLVLCQCLAVAAAIRALRLPTSVTAIEGGRAEFNCTTAGKAAGEELYWAIKWDDGSLLWYYLSAEVNGTRRDFLRGTSLVSIPGASLEGHGRYTTVRRREHRDGGRTAVDLCLLRVDGTRFADQGRYHCVYRRGGFFQNLYASGQSSRAELTVVVPPEGDAPSCGVSQVASADPTLGGALVELSCISSVMDVRPLPTITWTTGGRELSATTGNANLYRYTLKERDNGREFTCVVTHPGLQAGAGSCSVTPLNEPPRAVVTPERLVSAVGSDAAFRCIGSGIPYIVQYTWFVGDSPYGHAGAGAGGVTPEISLAGPGGWALSLPNLKPAANNTRVTCEVRLPSGLSSNASALLLLGDSLPLAVALSPRRARVFRDSDLAFSCFAETDAHRLAFTWYLNDSLVAPNSSAESQPLQIKSTGPTGSILIVSKERAAVFDNDVGVSCEATTPNGYTARDSGVVIAQKNTEIRLDISPAVLEVPRGAQATFTCTAQPDVQANSTYLWHVRCDPSGPAGPGEPGALRSESGSGTLTLSTPSYETQCAVTCAVRVPSGLTASATGLLVVQTSPAPGVGEVQQPETRSTSWQLPGALGAGGVGIFLGVCFCSVLLLLYSCSKSFVRYSKAGGGGGGGTSPGSQVSAPIYETINPQNASRDRMTPDVPAAARTARGPCQQQSNATYNRPPMTFPKMHVALPAHAHRSQLQRIPSSEAEAGEGEGAESVASSISKESLNTELGMNSSPSTVTFGGNSDSDEHEYESCEITTCV